MKINIETDNPDEALKTIERVSLFCIVKLLSYEHGCATFEIKDNEVTMLYTLEHLNRIQKALDIPSNKIWIY